MRETVVRSLPAAVALVLVLHADCALDTPGLNSREPAGNDSPSSHAAVLLLIQQIFSSPDEAAKGVCGWLRTNEPKTEQFEYCGFIYHDSQGIKVTIPMTMRRASQCNKPPAPHGMTVLGWYHSHRWSVEFSWLDKQHGTVPIKYLCAPNGQVKKLTPEGTVIVK